VTLLIEIFFSGARFCSVVGDFNNWEHRKHFAGEGYLGRDDFGYYRVRIDDVLRDGEEEDLITQVRLSSHFTWF
jgi:1,4-alpha-glucan branching enzyme